MGQLHDKIKDYAERRFPGDKERQEQYTHATLNKLKTEGSEKQKEAAEEES